MSNLGWRSILQYDPVPALAESKDAAIKLFAVRDLLDAKDQNPKALWDLPPAKRIVNKQQPDGSWEYPGGNKNIRTHENYNQIETFRNLGYLVEMYGFDKSSPAVAGAADFLFGFQTADGDIRGILGIQYTPYYTAGMTELLIKAGYANDRRVTKVFEWLKTIRQNDGGWAIPLRTLGKKLDVIGMKSATLEPDRSKPFSWLVTGNVLRAYAAHPKYRNSAEAKTAGKLLLGSLFKKDYYPDRGNADFWLRFTYPFWFTDLISALDSLSKLRVAKDEPQIQKAINWFVAYQSSSGLWNLKTLKNKKTLNTDLWISLAICRILKRLNEQ